MSSYYIEKLDEAARTGRITLESGKIIELSTDQIFMAIKQLASKKGKGEKTDLSIPGFEAKKTTCE